MARGSIYQRSSKTGATSWWVMVDIGPDPETGARRQRKRTFRTQRDAQRGLTLWLADLERGTAVDPSKMTVAAFLRHWLETVVKPNRRAATHAGYERLIRVQLIPRLGNVQLQRLSPVHIQQAYTAMLTGPRADGRSGVLSNRTVRYAHTVLKLALKHALRLHLITANPAENVDPPKMTKPEVRVWDQAEMRQFLEATKDDSYSALWQVALATGLRLGEIRGLRWCDIDLRNGALQVRQQITRVGGQDKESDPKTKAGRRTIGLPNTCIGVLRALNEQRPQAPLPIHRAQRDTGLMFAKADGRPLDQDAITSQFVRLVRRVGVTRISFHGLRHTHATLLLLKNVHVKAVSARLGHSSIQITLDYYGHLLPRMEQFAAEAMEEVLAGEA